MHQLVRLAVVAISAGIAAGETLYVSNYGATVHQLSFSGTTIEEVGQVTDCGLNPVWLELDKQSGYMICVNEAVNVCPPTPRDRNNTDDKYAQALTAAENISSVTIYDISSTPPVKLGNHSTLYGPAHSQIISPGIVSLADYHSSSVSVFNFSDPASLVQTQTFNYTMAVPGPDARQDSPHPHQVRLDPTGKFLLSPDLGSDLVHLYQVTDDGSLTDQGSFSTVSGFGPRHGAFVAGSDNQTFYYLLGEAGNGLAGYYVTYNTNDTLSFEQLYLNSTYQNGYGSDTQISPAEIFNPESNHLIISTRNDNRTTYNSSVTDSLLSYDIDLSTGDLTLTGITTAAGSTPRGFELNNNGTLVAVATQKSGRLAIFPRDTSTGLLSNTPLATWTTSVVDPAKNFSLASVVWKEGIEDTATL